MDEKVGEEGVMAEEKGALQRSIQAHIMEEIEERRSLSDEELWELIEGVL